MHKQMGWNFPRVIAHRGGGILAPENTLAAMRCGLMHGYRAVEFDVMCCADGVPVLMHDAQFGRTIVGTGEVRSTSAATLCIMDAGSWHSPAFAGETVPLFSQVIDFCRANGMWMNVEIKPAPGDDLLTAQAVAATLKAQMPSPLACCDLSSPLPLALPLISSFSLIALRAVRDTAPEIPRALLVDTLMPDWREVLQEIDACALHINHQHLRQEQALQIKAAGYGLMCFTVNDITRAQELLNWGVDAFCTDRIDLFAADFAQ